MSERWQYMTIVWGHISTPDRGLVQEYFINGAGRSEKRVSRAEHGEDEDFSFGDFLDELGAEGWELVSETVLETTLLPGIGWEQVGSPVRIRWMLKKRLLTP
jgi:hypothetical protein